MKGGSGFPGSPETAASIAESPARGLGRKLVRLLFLALGAAVIVTAGYFGYRYFLAASPTVTPPSLNENENVPMNGNVPFVPENTNTGNAIVNAPPSNANGPLQAPFINENPGRPNGEFLPPQDDPNSTVDMDQDGLTDYQEVRLYRTDFLKPDTDADGLSDRDEVNVWKTDPLKADTDGDGYVDGGEVKNGFNPLGPGKLLPPVIQ